MKPTLEAPESKLLKLEHENVLSNYAFKLNLRRYNKASQCCIILRQEIGRGLHSSTFRLKVSAFCGIGGALKGCLEGV